MEGIMKICINCHMTLDKDTEICPSCGVSQEDELEED